MDERWNEIRGIHKQYRTTYEVGGGFTIIMLLLLVGAILFANGALNDYSTNVFTEAVSAVASVIVTVLILDRRAEIREERRRLTELRQQLLREARSPENIVANHAMHVLREQGWLLRSIVPPSDGLLRGADLQSANLQGAVLSQADLRDANLERANLQKADLQAAKLDNANMQHIRANDGNFIDASLRNADLNMSELNGALFINSKLQGANLRAAKLLRARLETAELRGASMTGAWIGGARFLEADIVGVDFNGTLLMKILPCPTAATGSPEQT